MDFITLLLTSGAITGFLSFVFKKYIDHQLKLKEQVQMTDLKAKADREVAIYKAKLEQESLRFNVKTSGVYQKQADAITEIYNQLCDLEDQMNIAINTGVPWDEKYQKFESTYSVLRSFWRKNRILLSDKVDTLIRALLNDTFWAVQHYGSGESSILRGNFDSATVQKDKASELMQSIPQILEQLIIEFRDNIGVTEKNL